MPQGVKKDLMNLEIDFSRRKSPKRKLKRSVESQIISMCNKLYGFHPEQRALMLRAAAANLGQAEEDDTEKLVLGLLQKIKPCKSADAKAIKSLLCGLVHDHLRELSRDQRRAVGASDGAFRAAQSVVEKLEQKEFSWMHPEKVIRSTKPNRGSALSRSSSVGSGGSRSEARRRGSPGVRPGRGKRAERKDSSEDS